MNNIKIFIKVYKKTLFKFIFITFALLINNNVYAALFSATWTAGTPGGTTASGTIGPVSINLTTVGIGNSTQIFPGTWSQILPPSLGTISPDSAISLGYQCNNTPQTQQVSFGSPVTNPYLLFNYVEGASSYVFNPGSGAVSIAGNTVSATLSSSTVTIPSGSFNRSQDGFAVQLTGTYSSLTFTINKNGGCGSGSDSVGFDVAEAGYSVTPSATGGGTITPSTVIVVLPNTSANFTIIPNAGYSVSMAGTCGGNLSGTSYTTRTITQDCTVNASFVTNPQAALFLSAIPTQINTTESSQLSTTGGSGTGLISYNVLSGPCTISGSTLNPSGTAGSCVVQATKAGDATYSPVTSNQVTVNIDLTPQATLNLSASDTGIVVTGTSTLTATGGSGTGLLGYNLLSGPCSLNSTTGLLTGTGQGDCQIQASKAADGTYAATDSNIVIVHVVLKPQATLLLNADRTGIQIGQTSTLSTTGGSGTGAVIYTVLSGPCTANGGSLNGTGQGSCQVQATKMEDGTYSSTTSNIVTVYVTSIPQATLVLNANPANILVNQTSTLSTSGGSGTGSVFYTVLSGPCSIVSNNTIKGTGKGDCQGS